MSENEGGWLYTSRMGQGGLGVGRKGEGYGGRRSGSGVRASTTMQD